MKVKVLGVMGLIATLTAAGHVSADSDKAVVYQGDNAAKNVCLSIIADNSDRLHAALRSDRFKTRQWSDNQDNFRCNDMALIDFANEVGAYNVSHYLNKGDKGRVDMEEVASR